MRIALLLPLTVLSLYAQTAVDSDVQAFIEQLHGSQRVEPVLPPEIRDLGWHGEVKLLLKLDTAGNVMSVEPLSGPPTLRQPAVDAVRQWRFQPVIRAGRPVTAMVTETIWFHQPGPVHSEPAPIEESMSALRRIHELRDRFPQSSKQLLADLEQSLVGASAKERGFQLPELAKAAIQARDLPKATSYANELLNSSHDGAAVHEGNVLLGLIAMKDGNLIDARSYLLLAGESPASPLLDIPGPNMTLARALLEAGERDTVLQYFDGCRAFWKRGADKLDQWSATVRGGGMPDFGPSLLY